MLGVNFDNLLNFDKHTMIKKGTVISNLILPYVRRENFESLYFSV